METRTIRMTLTFQREFVLPQQTATVPPGDYVLLIEEERLQGLTFDAYRRIAGHLIIPGGPAHPGRTEMIPVTEADVSALVICDAAPVAAPSVATVPALCGSDVRRNGQS
jgi:hypothetical protein